MNEFKLTKDDIGKKIASEGAKHHAKFEVVMVGEKDAVLLHDSGKFYVSDLYGKVYEKHNHSVFNVVIEDKRWWLKQLPDADLLAEMFTCIACDDNCISWFAYSIEPITYSNVNNKEYRAAPLSALKMPILNNEEWKQSLISIKELREFQQQNKK